MQEFQIRVIFCRKCSYIDIVMYDIRFTVTDNVSYARECSKAGTVRRVTPTTRGSPVPISTGG